VSGRLRRHPQALADVEESAVHIGAGSVEAALRFLGAVEATLKMLAQYPELGASRSFERRDLAGLRSFPLRGFDQHWIFYRPIEAGIEVVRVLHGARDLGGLFGEERTD
jgi:toxin ParE1/3/4